MKISESLLQFKTQNTQSQDRAQVLSSRVQTQVSGQTNTLTNSQASITQTQQQTLQDSISSNGVSHIKQGDGNPQVIQHSQLIESITQANLTTGITIRAVNALGQALPGNFTENQSVNEIQITRILSFNTQSEQQVQTLGSVTTEDGRQIDFMMEVNYQREIEARQTSQFNGERNLIDPLVINLSGGTAELSDLYFEFDLNGDGQTENLHQTAGGTGFLAFDKNQNGKIDDGSELFGPNSHSGFAELAQYDSDQNGWIDENDDIYSQLSFMDFNEDGQPRLRSIEDVKIGAIALESRDLDFELYDSQGNFQAQVARTGVALSENGQVLSVQEIYYQDQAFGQGQLQRIESIDLNSDNQTVRIESPLTQFQFDNEAINARVAQTQVRLELPSFSSRPSASPTPQANTNMNPAATTAQNRTRPSISNEALEQKKAIQEEFRNRLETEYKDIKASSNNSGQTQDFQYVEIATQSQSIFWQNTGNHVSNSHEDSKLSELKELVESLKVIRENQVKMQDKLGVYLRVSNEPQ